MNLHAAAHRCLTAADPATKCALTAEAAARFARGDLDLDPRGFAEPATLAVPGRPDRPRLVAPRDLPSRGLGTAEGRAALIHAIAHIEFNAINLAWDAVYRFRDMPPGFAADWVAVAADEARHFELLARRLQELGHAYGDFDAHNGLWEMAHKTAGSCQERMALVPRVLEARGLDVTPGMISRLRHVGDAATAQILELILREEVAHVATGDRWFRWCCSREGLEPETTFRALLARHGVAPPRAPFNREARQAAGFSPAELAHFEAAP
jgi:uncharacterized ferritin-like protein (DUF455 family)